ncbi:hypothetical protein BBJ28_00007566 [Nothophytophthora sp. Chile5]|nr:hypothetical protein BBJ28_00007566 [Nothophytophthora sp. Chile5]
MATEDEVKALARLDLPALRRDFERLSVDDLSALASFPAEPHALIGRVVGVVHCLLLSLAPEHATLALCAPPWALLRLQLLVDTSAVWKKLRKRICQLEAGVKTLATAQIRFACEEFVPLLLPPQQHKPRHHDWQLERLAQVSTIAASLGAWAACCLCYSLLRSTSNSLNIGRASHCQDDCIEAQTLPDPMQQPRPRSPRRRDPSYAAKTMGSRVTSRRAGLKLGSCFLLFHARLSEHMDDVKDLVTFALPDEWAVYRLDTNRLGRQKQPAAATSSSSPAFATGAAWWKPFHPIDPTASRHLALSLPPPPAQQALLFQLGFHAHLFEPRMQVIPHAKLLPPTAPVFTLKFAIVAAIPRQQLSLLGIGSVLVTLGTTVAALRSQLVVSLASCLSNAIKPDSFRFLYRGSLLPRSQERHLEATALLPFALLVFAEDGDAVGPTQPREFHFASQLWRFHDEVSQALVNAGVPDHLSSASTDEAAQCFAMCQPLASSSTGHSAPTAPTSSTIAEFLTHWRAFVRFQQLQDSVVLFRHSPKKKKKAKMPRRHRLNGSQDRDSDQGGGDEEDEGVQQGPQLPRQVPSLLKKEWLQPLYALATVVSATTATLKTPYSQDIEQALASSHRLVLGTEDHVVHVTRINGQVSECDVNGVLLSTMQLSFQRDESCPLASLLEVQAAYTWLILPHKPDSNPPSPPKWLCDLYRFVRHPVYDFQGLKQQQHRHFRVHVTCQLVERAIEARCWSRRLDWTPSLNATDLHDTLLRQIFDSLCHSHPPALAVDSVKFSKLLYEAHVQPSRLGIGDAAFLFASNLTPGSAYEMDFDGFVRAIEWLAQRFYSDSDVKGTSRPKKIIMGVQSSPSKRQHARVLSPLRRLCFETLVHLPSLQAVWHRLVDSWRRERKQQVLNTFAFEYCAATRLQACWKRFITWKTYLEERQRMKDERLAATKLQSHVRGRQSHLNYIRVRQAARKVQLRVKARRELRRLRAERVAFLERMRLRLVQWMRWQLQVLRAWKRGNPEQAARRERIREKRERRLGVTVFPLATRRLRFSLYRAKPGLPEDEAQEPSDTEQTPLSWYELEVLDASRSWGQVLCVSQNQIDRLEAEELERVASQQPLRPTVCTSEGQRSRSSATSKESEKQPKRDSVVYPRTKSNATMLALARRLFVQEDVRRSSGILRWYVNPTGTSLGTVRQLARPSQDVPLPPDEWQPIARLAAVEVDTTGSLRFVNPRRGVYSRFNDSLAATAIQRWFRTKMWAGINDWALRDVVRALRYHRAAQKPTNVADPRQLDNLKRHTLQLHQARGLVSSDLATALLEIEENGVRWALFLQPKNPHVR